MNGNSWQNMSNISKDTSLYRRNSESHKKLYQRINKYTKDKTHEDIHVTLRVARTKLISFSITYFFLSM